MNWEKAIETARRQLDRAAMAREPGYMPPVSKIVTGEMLPAKKKKRRMRSKKKQSTRIHNFR